MDDILGKERNDMNPNIGMKRSTVLLVAIVTQIFWSSSFFILVEYFASPANAAVFMLALLTNNMLFYAWLSLLNIFLGYNRDHPVEALKEDD